MDNAQVLRVPQSATADDVGYSPHELVVDLLLMHDNWVFLACDAMYTEACDAMYTEAYEIFQP